MSNRNGLCWECRKRESCSLFRKNPITVVSDCRRFENNDKTMTTLISLMNHRHEWDKAEIDERNWKEE